MALLHYAATVPINPPNASPVLSVKDIWNAMVIKCREPQHFVPVIATCTVTKEDENGMTRDVTMKELPDMPKGVQTEIITYSKPYVVTFQNAHSPMRVLNTISHGPDLDSETDLHMTFTFDYPVPDLDESDVQQRSEKYWAKLKELRKMALGATSHSVEASREMKGKGLLEDVGIGGI